MFFTHGRGDRDEQVLALSKSSFNGLSDFVIWKLDVVLGGSVVIHERHESFINVEERKFVLANVRDIHVVGGRGKIFKLLVGKDLKE